MKRSWTTPLEPYVSWNMYWYSPEGNLRICLAIRGPRRDGPRPQQTMLLKTIQVGEPQSLKNLKRKREYSRMQHLNSEVREQRRKYAQRPKVKKRNLKLARARMAETYSLALSIVTDGLPKCALQDSSCRGQLEIDHIHNDGKKERAIRHHKYFYRDIVSGSRPTNDLRVLCHLHNVREFRRKDKETHK